MEWPIFPEKQIMPYRPKGFHFLVYSSGARLPFYHHSLRTNLRVSLPILALFICSLFRPGPWEHKPIYFNKTALWLVCLPKFPLFFREGFWQAGRLCISSSSGALITWQGGGDREAACRGRIRQCLYSGGWLPVLSESKGRSRWPSRCRHQRQVLDKPAAGYRLRLPLFKDLNV